MKPLFRTWCGQEMRPRGALGLGVEFNGGGLRDEVLALVAQNFSRP